MREHDINILLIEDNPGDVRLLKEYLSEVKRTTFNVKTTGSLTDGIEMITSNRFDAILLDLSLPDCTGIDTLLNILKRAKQEAVIVLTGLKDEDVAVEAVRQGAQDYIMKDQLDHSLLARSIYYSVERKQAELRIIQLNQNLEKRVHERTVELQDATNKLIKREKLAILGRLTATVSHELRNPLSVIRISVYYLQKHFNEIDDKLSKHLNRIKNQIDTCDSIVEELLEYTRGKHSEAIPDNMLFLLEDVLDQIEENLPYKQVCIHRKLPLTLPVVCFDNQKIQRVIINLVNNAIQAVSAQQPLLGDKKKFKPEVIVSASTIDKGICIVVDDNGTGMDQETLDRAFEPLFTTNARGTGLGLAVVKKIIEEHDGSISLSSKLGIGTKISFIIPIPEKNAQS